MKYLIDIQNQDSTRYRLKPKDNLHVRLVRNGNSTALVVATLCLYTWPKCQNRLYDSHNQDVV